MGPGRRHLTSTHAGKTSHQGGQPFAPRAGLFPGRTRDSADPRGDSGPLLFAGRSFIGAFRRSATSHRQSCPVGQSHVLKTPCPLGSCGQPCDFARTRKNPAGRCRLLDDLSTDTHAVEAIESSVLCRCGTCPSRRRLAQCGVPGPIPRDRAAADGHGAPLGGQRPTLPPRIHGGDPSARRHGARGIHRSVPRPDRGRIRAASVIASYRANEAIETAR